MSTWEVEFTDEFGVWWKRLSEAKQVRIAASVRLLEELGPQLGYPHSSGIRGSRLGHLRELRIQASGRPIRILFAFDPRRVAILLIGGEKESDPRFYERLIPKAEQLYARHLAALRTSVEQGSGNPGGGNGHS